VNFNARLLGDPPADAAARKMLQFNRESL